MTFVRAIGALLVLLVLPLQAATFITFEQITVSTTAIGFTTTKIRPAGTSRVATQAVCRVRTQALTFTINTEGTAPEAAVGTAMSVDEVWEFNGHDVLRQFRVIRSGGADGQLDCHYSDTDISGLAPVRKQ